MKKALLDHIEENVRAPKRTENRHYKFLSEKIVTHHLRRILDPPMDTIIYEKIFCKNAKTIR